MVTFYSSRRVLRSRNDSKYPQGTVLSFTCKRHRIQIGHAALQMLMT